MNMCTPMPLFEDDNKIITQHLHRRYLPTRQSGPFKLHYSTNLDNEEDILLRHPNNLNGPFHNEPVSRHTRVVFKSLMLLPYHIKGKLESPFTWSFFGRHLQGRQHCHNYTMDF